MLVVLLATLVVAGTMVGALSLVLGRRVVSSRNGSCGPKVVQPARSVTDAYDRRVLSFSPVLYLTLAHPFWRVEPDLSGHEQNGEYLPKDESPGLARLPNGDAVAEFDGLGQYVQVRSSSVLSVTRTGCLTVQAWFRPATLQFPREEGSGYVYVLGKGASGRQEYALRMYSYSNKEHPPRPNRVSAYVFNLAGGEGSGSYFQDDVHVGEWIMATFVVEDRATTSWPDGYIAIYEDGALRGMVSLEQFHVVPGASSAPFRIATRDLHSYFQGAIGKVAVYDEALTGSDIRSTYLAMVAQHR